MAGTIILGAGIAGLGAGYALRQKGEPCVILEKDDTYGGLCGNFSIRGFRFDRFVHFSFAKDEAVNSLFRAGSPEVWHHEPIAYNIYHGKWIKHPAQNNLFPLAESEKERIIQDFLKRKNPETTEVRNYEDWLRLQFGDYFAEHFPMVYTRKYWMREARELETRWVGNRVYQPSVEEVIKGSKTADTPTTYYAKEMRYPKKGGYKQYLSKLAEGADIRYHEAVVGIDSREKTVFTTSGRRYVYDRLISSLPLPALVRMLSEVPETIAAASELLVCTCGYQISVGLKTENIPPYLWWYIYDEENLAARVYSPSLKSPDNAPEGCSSLQMEVYCRPGQYSEAELQERTVGHLIRLGIIKEEDILFVDIRFEPYANVIFEPGIYQNRRVVRTYLKSIGIETIGRFGEWDYLWSDQSLLSGLRVVER
jgi:protoporphyrinogen oxidase